MTKTTLIGGAINKLSKGKATFSVTNGSFTSSAAHSNVWQGKEGTSEHDYTEGKKKDEKKECKCKVSKPAKDFKSLIELVKQAEEMLIENGLEEMGIRINTIRGIYYGTIWSLDYKNEKSKARNFGFYVYTKSMVKYDAREKLKCSEKCKANLFDSLFNSYEIQDGTYKSVDFGHLIIGMDSRRSILNRNFPVGLEKNTWVGDLGGGAGALAKQRITHKDKRAKTVFVDKHSYGATANLEGDIAGYIVGMSEDKPDEIIDSSDNFNSIHEALHDYFEKKWSKRTFFFLAMLGAKVANNKIIYVRNELIKECATKLAAFAGQYLALRLADRNAGGTDTLVEASNNFQAVSEEISSIFIDALIHIVENPQEALTARTDPNPGKPEETTIYKLHRRSQELYKNAVKNGQKIYKKTESELTKFVR